MCVSTNAARFCLPIERTCSPWRDLPREFRPWQTVWKRHRRYAADGTWDRVLTALLTLADTAGDLEWVGGLDRLHDRAGAPARRGRQARLGVGVMNLLITR
ncbi:transposase [Nocardia gipuzkoensis]|uniref:transposase n=1 Tax=Nocardia gipuzkoensis TaxID=2749991 RepID=UPI0015EF76CA